MKTKLSKLIYAALILLCSSCSPKIYSLQGNYDVITSIETTSSFNDVWNKVIDFFAMNNITISTIEKSSGIIAANAIGFDKSCISMEDKDGVIHNRNTWFVMPYEKGYTPVSITCSFNVRVRQLDNGAVSISINIGNITGKVAFSNFFTIGVIQYNRFNSTGKFENDLLTMFK